MNSKIFDDNIETLIHLFKENKVEPRIDRLRDIFHSVELAWYRNLSRFDGKRIGKILIGEAAPWSENGLPRYFYNRIESRYHNRIWKGINPDICLPSDHEKAYRMLAAKGFLLIDSLPYSMNYKGKMSNKYYIQLIQNSLLWWIEKLNNCGLDFEDKLSIAFAFKINGKSIMNELNHNLKLKGKEALPLSDNLISADGSGFTNSNYLSKILEIN
jgi:hypothetical protein